MVGDRLQRLATVQAAGGVDVGGRHGEQQTPAERRQPAGEPTDEPDPPRPEDVIGPVDRDEERVEMLGGPGGLGGRNQHERQRCAFEPARQRGSAAVPGLADDDLGFAAPLAQEGGDPVGDPLRFRRIPAGDGDDPHAGPGERVAAEVGGEWVVGLGVRHEAGPPSQPASSSRNAACRPRAIGPGVPSPTGRPSIEMTGRTSIVVPVSITSSARRRSSSEIVIS